MPGNKAISSPPRKQPNSRISVQAVIERVIQQGADGLLSRGEAAALIASRLPNFSRNRIAMRMDRAANKGSELHQGGLARDIRGCSTVDEIVRFAEKTFLVKFTDLPTKPREIMMSATSGLGLADGISAEDLPGTVEGSHELIAKLRTAIRDTELASKQAAEHRKKTLSSYLKKEK